MKPFGEDLGPADVRSLSPPIEAKAVLLELQEQVPEFTTHMTAEALPAFMGMQPGGNSPFTPKARGCRGLGSDLKSRLSVLRSPISLIS